MSCDKAPIEPKMPTLDNSHSESTLAEFEELSLAIPDSVPDFINDLAAARAVKQYCDGLRILEVETKTGVRKYHVRIFNESMDNIIDECFLTKDGRYEELEPAYCGLIDQKWRAEHAKLKKAFPNDETAADMCVVLAEFWVDASQGGNSFRVTQAANYTTGYFHKLIYCLGTSSCLIQCQAPWFPGGFNNLISSHDWDSFSQNGYYTWPDLIRVYDGLSLTDLEHTFYGSAAAGDGNWGDNGCNDEASSLRLQYYIRYY